MQFNIYYLRYVMAIKLNSENVSMNKILRFSDVQNKNIFRT